VGPSPTDGDAGDEGASRSDAPERCAGDDGRDAERYRLVSVDGVRAPSGCAGSDWHIYHIAQGHNAITGYRRGDLAHVTADVEAIVTALNGRRQWAKSKAPSKNPRRAAAATARRAAAK
jgi:hypothetical protein